jgi:dihydroorotate dehydrogenase
MLLPYALIRPIFFSFDAEKVHDFTLNTLKFTQNTWLGQSLLSQPKVNDPIQLMGLEFSNRVGLAAGLDKNASAIDAFAAMGFVTLRSAPSPLCPRRGTPNLGSFAWTRPRPSSTDWALTTKAWRSF